jgi:hypothetical protein
MGKKKAEAAPVAVMEISPAAQAVRDLCSAAQDAGAKQARAEGGFEAAGELLKRALFIPSDEKVEGSDSAKIRDVVEASYFVGYGKGKGCSAKQMAWLAANSVKGLEGPDKLEADKLLKQARSAFGMFWRRAKQSAKLVPVEAGQPVGGAVAAGSPAGEGEDATTMLTKESAAALLADGDLTVAQWLLWAASKEGRGHLKATYSANVKP